MMKKKVRKAVLQLRNCLTNAEVKDHSQSICEQLKPYLKGIVGMYRAYGSEVDVRSLETEKIPSALPKANSNHTLQFFEICADTIFEKSHFGIEEPVNGKLVEHMDVLLVPLVAFDEHCNRLGHGAGYYDRYLKNFQGLKIGVAHECQKVEQVYEERHDIPLDFIVTETTIYRRGS